MKYKTTHSDVGRLRQRIELQKYVTVSDGQGGTTATWQELDTVWADIKPVGGSERYEIESLKGNITHTVIIRYYSGLSNENRFLFNGKPYYIKYPLNKGHDNTYMELAVTEEQND